jgi:hypothetical protein
MDVKSTGTVGDGYEPPRVQLGMDMKSAGTVGNGYTILIPVQFSNVYTLLENLPSQRSEIGYDRIILYVRILTDSVKFTKYQCCISAIGV